MMGKVMCTIKGSYIDAFGSVVEYSYRVFDNDTFDTLVRLKNYELNKHPNAKQIIIWED